MILLFDIGKTNKKCFVLDEDYRVVFEKTALLPETQDEDGDACEDLNLLENWVLTHAAECLQDPRFQIRAMNCTAYGASFVHLDAGGRPLTPLYNYLKPYPEDLAKQFFGKYGGEEKMALETASPVLGSLNSGLQLYRLKHHKPAIFKQIKWSVHLPQYLALLLARAGAANGWWTNSGTDLKPPPDWALSEITGIGCHTMLWNFRKNDYHAWVKAEGIAEKLPPLLPAADWPSARIGTGLHDSSAALIPYLACFDEPFVLISTGTWCISLNPFNREPLSPEELRQDCLCYLTFEGQAVKAARYFGGHEHDQAVKNLAAQFGAAENFYQTAQGDTNPALTDAYLNFMRQLVEKQANSTRLVLGNPAVRRIFVDGGFSRNEHYMRLLAEAFPNLEVFAAELAQATVLGAALAMHPAWNSRALPRHLISLKKYPSIHHPFTR